MTDLIKVSSGLTGKMQDMTVITTAMTQNDNCKRLSAIKGSICEHCYSRQALAYRHKVRTCYEKNGDILSGGLIPDNQLPYINSVICRLESHGDLINETHLQNYINLVQKNPHCMFALWTKQYAIILSYFKNHTQPDNLIVVVSSPIIGREIDLTPYKKLGMNVKSFTVYPKGTTDVNCGDKHCIDCRVCYIKDSTQAIKEVLK